MTTIRWSPEAADDLRRIIHYIREHNRAAAERVARLLRDNIAAVARFPESGRTGRLTDTRELVIAGLPFIVVYRIRKDSIELVRILHGAQQWP